MQQGWVTAVGWVRELKRSFKNQYSKNLTIKTCGFNHQKIGEKQLVKCSSIQHHLLISFAMTGGIYDAQRVLIFGYRG